MSDTSIYETERESARLVEADSLTEARRYLAGVLDGLTPRTRYQERVYGFLWARRAFVAYSLGDTLGAAYAYDVALSVDAAVDTATASDWLRWAASAYARSRDHHAALRLYDRAEQMALALGDTARASQARRCRADLLRTPGVLRRQLPEQRAGVPGYVWMLGLVALAAGVHLVIQTWQATRTKPPAPPPHSDVWKRATGH